MNDHLSERQLEYFIRSRDKLSEEEKKNIIEHLDSCHLCREHLDIFTEYLDDVENELSQPPGQRDYTLASKIFGVDKEAALPTKSLVKTYKAPLKTYRNSITSKIIEYIQHYPFRSATLVAASAAFIFILFFKPWVNQDPAYAEVKNNVFYVFNNNGDKLWHMPASGLPEDASSKDHSTNSQKKYIAVENIDGKGSNEILITGEHYNSRFAVDTLYCFNGDGILKWKQGIPSAISFGSMNHAGKVRWKIEDFFTLNQPDKNKTQLFSLANGGLWFPSVFYEIAPSDGNITQTYWHAGHIRSTHIFNTDEKSNAIILGGINNSFNRASIAVLDPQNISGHGPMNEDFKPSNISPANEIYYLTFTPSILGSRYNTTPYNQISNIYPTGKQKLAIGTTERIKKLSTDHNVSVNYILNDDFSVSDVYGDDNFVKLYSELYEDGELEKPLNEQFWKELKESVFYWNGKKFIHKPVELK